MEYSQLGTVVTALIILSVASERLVEIVKGFTPALNIEKTDPEKEGRRRAYLHVLAVLAGVFTAFLAKDLLETSSLKISGEPTSFLALGLLASGGSGLWNSILEYLNEVKKLKKVKVVEAKEIRE